MSRIPSIGAFLVISLVLCVPPGWTQVTTATLHGLVLDSTGAAIPGAHVTIANQGTVAKEQLTTDGRGEFTANFLPVGIYLVTIEVSGFRTYRETNLELIAGQEVRRDFALQVGRLGESVTVSAEAPLVNAVNAEQDITRTRYEVQELPFSQRDVSNILNLGAGVESGHDIGVSMNGLAPRGFMFTIDGVNAAGSSELRGMGLYQDFNSIKGESMEAIQEIDVAKGIFSAEIANTISGNVNFTTKSGTNQYHGSAFWVYQDGGINARYQFLTSPAPLVWNQFGGSVGGPIRQNKMFFFGVYEGYRDVAQTPVSGNVPSPQIRALAAQANPALASYFALWPLPTGPVASGAATGFYTGVNPAKANDNHALVRWDDNITPTDVINIRYRRGRPYQLTPALLASDGQTTHGLSENVAGTFIHSRPTWSSETRAGYNRNDLTRTDAWWDAGVISVGGPSWSAPASRLFGMSGSTSTFEEVLATVRGRHTLKVGGLFELEYARRVDIGNPSYTYQTQTALLSLTPTSASFRFGVNPWQLSQWALGGFIQDEIKVTDRLMVTFGGRYDYWSVPRERDGRFYNRDGPFGPLRPADSAWNAPDKNFAPRASLAWRLDKSGKTVLRSGFGIFFSQQNLFSGATDLIQNNAATPLQASFSSAQMMNWGINYPNTNAQVLPKVLTFGLITNTAIDPNWKNPYSQQWTISLQRQLSGTMALDISYVGNHALRLPYSQYYNTVNRVTGLPVNPQFGTNFYYYQSIDASKYDALQAQFHKRFSKNLSWDSAYSYASNNSFFRGDMHCCTGAGDQPQDPNDLRSNYGPTTFFVRHQFRTNWIYELPLTSLFPNGGRLTRLLLGGWQTAGMFNAQTGDSMVILQNSSVPTARPDYVGGSAILGLGMQYLNKAAFAPVPVSPVSNAPVRPGTLGRRAVYAPNWWNTNMSLSKRVRFTEQCNLQFRIDTINFFNHTNFGSATSGVSGIDNVINDPNFGQYTATRGARLVQFNVRLQF